MYLTKSGESGKDCKGVIDRKDKRERNLFIALKHIQVVLYLFVYPSISSSFACPLHSATSEDQSDRRTACTPHAPRPLTLTFDLGPTPAARSKTRRRSDNLEERAAEVTSSARAWRDGVRKKAGQVCGKGRQLQRWSC